MGEWRKQNWKRIETAFVTFCDVTLSICDVTLKSVTLLMYQRYREEIGIGRFCDDLTQFSILPF